MNPFASLRSRHRATQKSLDRARETARDGLHALLSGEPGIGKSRLAHAIHLAGPRAHLPFVEVLPGVDFSTVECAIERAQQGVLLVRNGILLPLDVLRRLERAMDEEDILVILSTDRTSYEIQTNSLLIPAPLRFPRTRPIRLFPLRRRIADLPDLFQHALDVECAALGREHLSWSEDVSRLLREHPWSGNLHELHRRARDGARSATSNILRLEDLLEPHGHAARSDRLDELVRVHTLRVYEDCGGDVHLAASRLGLSVSRLYSRLHEYGLARRQKRDAS